MRDPVSLTAPMPAKGDDPGPDVADAGAGRQLQGQRIARRPMLTRYTPNAALIATVRPDHQHALRQVGAL